MCQNKPDSLPQRAEPIPNEEWDKCVQKSSWTIGLGTIVGTIASIFIGSETPILAGTALGIAWSVKRCRALFTEKAKKYEEACKAKCVVETPKEDIGGTTPNCKFKEPPSSSVDNAFSTPCTEAPPPPVSSCQPLTSPMTTAKPPPTCCKKTPMDYQAHHPMSCQPTPPMNCQPTPPMNCQPTPRMNCQPVPPMDCKPPPTIDCQPPPAMDCQPPPPMDCQPPPSMDCQPHPPMSCQPPPPMDCQPPPQMDCPPPPPPPPMDCDETPLDYEPSPPHMDCQPPPPPLDCQKTISPHLRCPNENLKPSVDNSNLTTPCPPNDTSEINPVGEESTTQNKSSDGQNLEVELDCFPNTDKNKQELTEPPPSKRRSWLFSRPPCPFQKPASTKENNDKIEQTIQSANEDSNNNQKEQCTCCPTTAKSDLKWEDNSLPKKVCGSPSKFVWPPLPSFVQVKVIGPPECTCEQKIKEPVCTCSDE